MNAVRAGGAVLSTPARGSWGRVRVGPTERPATGVGPRPAGPPGIHGPAQPPPPPRPAAVLPEQDVEYRLPLVQIAEVLVLLRHVLSVKAVVSLLGAHVADGAVEGQPQPHLHVAGVGELAPVPPHLL